MQILKYDYDPLYEYSISNSHLTRTIMIAENSLLSRPYEEYTTIYDGTFINDITSYINEASVYVIKVNFRYKSTKGILSFGIVNDGENLLTM